MLLFLQRIIPQTMKGEKLKTSAMKNLIGKAMSSPVFLDVTQDVDGLNELSDLVKTIISILTWGITVIGVIIVIAIGFQFMTAQQAEERQKLKGRMIWFGIGTGIVFASATIWTILQNVFVS